MSVEKVARKWLDRVSTGDGPGALDLFADDIEYILQGSTPVSGTYRGKQSVVDYFLVPWRKQIDGEKITHVNNFLDTAMVETAAYGKTLS